MFDVTARLKKNTFQKLFRSPGGIFKNNGHLNKNDMKVENGAVSMPGHKSVLFAIMKPQTTVQRTQTSTSGRAQTFV